MTTYFMIFYCKKTYFDGFWERKYGFHDDWVLKRGGSTTNHLDKHGLDASAVHGGHLGVGFVE